MSIQSQHAVATRSAPQPERADVPAHRALLRALILAGARGATPAAVTAALMRYWQELRSASVTQRSRVVAELRGAVRRDETTSRAWLTVALLQLGDVTINERLAGLRGRLNAAEAAAVWCVFADCDGTPSGDFIAEWRACA